MGVKRQYCGELGKRANGQAGMFLGYASQQGHTSLDRRLYVPQEGVEDKAYAERPGLQGPRGQPFHHETHVGWGDDPGCAAGGNAACGWVACDEAVGRDTTRLDHIAGAGVVVQRRGAHDTQVWRVRRRRGCRHGRAADASPPANRWSQARPRRNRWHGSPLRCGSAGGRGIP